jgi:hypothetical protein
VGSPSAGDTGPGLLASPQGMTLRGVQSILARAPALVPATAALVALLVSLLFAASAHAVVYWQTMGPYSGNALNRANLDKNPPEATQLPFVAMPPGTEIGDLTAYGGFLYWIDPITAAIGRMRADGTQIEPSFVATHVFAFANQSQVAVNSSGIYWTRPGGTVPGQNTIARADLDGSNVNTNFIALSFPAHEVQRGLAASETHLFWSGLTEFGDNVIGRANTDGSGVNPALVSLGPDARPAALAATNNHVYWTDQGSAFAGIGRASADGSEVISPFVPASAGGAASDLAVGGQYLFWRDYLLETVGRMGLDGSGMDRGFIPRSYTHPDDVLGAIAADPLARPTAVITKAPKKKTRKRKAKIAFTSPDVPDASFQCKLDKKAYRPCSSPVKVKAKPGKHKFRVKAVNATGPSPYPARTKWKVERRR